VNPDGFIVAVEPAEYRSAEGADISGQPQVAFIREHHQPVLSDLFLAVEGFPALDFEWPLSGEGGAYLGALSLLFDHVRRFSAATAPVVAGTRYSVTIQQLDGTILYDADPAQVGKNVFTDPEFQAYPDLIRQVREVVAAESGSGRYSFRTPGSDQPIYKRCRWTTIRRYEAEWRLAVFWSE